LGRDQKCLKYEAIDIAATRALWENLAEEIDEKVADGMAYILQKDHGSKEPPTRHSYTSCGHPAQRMAKRNKETKPTDMWLDSKWIDWI
jgi:hypothetical protein